MGRNKKNKLNLPKVFIPKAYPKNFDYTIIETKSLIDGIPFMKSIAKDNHNRKYNLANLAERDPTCVCCKRIGVKFSLGIGKFSGQKNRGLDQHWDLYTEDDVVMSIDHIIPKSKGGVNHISNYQLMCIECNNLKSNYPNRLIPYMILLRMGFNVFPMSIGSAPYLVINYNHMKLPTEIYERLSDYILEKIDGNQYKYFIID